MATPERRPEPVVRLRPAAPRDADLLWRWRGEWSIRRYQPLHDLTIQQLRNEVAAQKVGDLYQGRGEKFQWIVLVDDQASGWITLVVNNWEHGLGEIGYALGASTQGRGVMTRAVALLVDEAFRRSPIERLEARCAVENSASRRVLEKNGFRYEGLLRGYFRLRGRRIDNLLFALLRTDYFGLR